MESKNELGTLFDLSGRVAMVSGAAGLLGPGFCRSLAHAGATVIAADLRGAACDALAQDLRAESVRDAMSLHMDVSDADSVEAGFAEVVRGYGRLDILVNAVAHNPVTAGAHAPFERYALDVWTKVIQVNLTGVMLCCQAAGRQMVTQGGGVIVNIASVYGMVGADQRIYGDSGLNSPASYAASKGGIISLTRYLAAYWEGKNIRVNCMSPGGVQSATVGEKGKQNDNFLQNYGYRNMLHRMARKEELWGGLVYLCSDASSFVTGTNLVVDGGWTAW